MNLYLLTQTENRDYDTYDSIVVAANSLELAVQMHPDEEYGSWSGGLSTTWASSPTNVTCKLIGKAVSGTTSGIILASFNAG